MFFSLHSSAMVHSPVSASRKILIFSSVLYFLPFMSGSFLAQTNSQGGLKIRGHVSSLPGNTALSVAYPRASEVKRSSSTSETGDSEEFTTDKPHHAVTSGRIAGLKICRPLKACGFDPHPGHQPPLYELRLGQPASGSDQGCLG